MRALLLPCALALPLFAGACASARRAGLPDAPARFEGLKSLAGDWTSTGGSMPAGASVRYRLVGGGSALVEELFTGLPHEMVTVYHLDGADLVLTHYCAMGNQPHMRAREARPDGTLVFVCEGGANVDCASSAHMHVGRLRRDGQDRVTSTWTFHDGGQATQTVTLELVRDPG